MAALLRCTRSPWELIVVNNRSTDGTRDYLAGVQDAAPVAVTVIANSSKVGFPAAINQGLAHARGVYLVLLNDDAVVTEGWLEQLVALSRAAVGTATHAISPETCGLAGGGDPSGARRPSTNGTAVEVAGGPETNPTGPCDFEATGGAATTPRGRATSSRQVAPGPPPLGRETSGRRIAPGPPPLAPP